MNVWFRDPRVEAGERKSFEAERAEKRGDFATARNLHHEAADAFAAVAIGVPSDHPNTRSDLGIAAVASYARAGDFGRAIEFAQRMLAEGDALSDHGRAELDRLARRYALLALLPVPRVGGPPHRPKRGHSVREQVRSAFKRAS